ncbi:MAG: efflux RND transporter periplasmic adaptor subunit [Flavobacteriaceae bacterium]|nr:efflux RND transporter periplasmic adaptor subunit [Flavobacteriaceae bacterium]
MKKYLIYIGLIVVGLFLGKMFFANSSINDSTQNHSEEKVNQMWTCSMHPQIMQPEAGDCPICGMDLIPAEVGADGLEEDQFKLSENAMALANIQTITINDSNNQIGSNAIKLSGKIVENEDATSVQTAHFGGRIERLYVSSVGEKVNRGKLLARIYSPELFAAQQELLTAASLKESQPALYKAVRGKLNLWKLSEKQINSIEISGKPIANFPIYANVSGVVSMKMVEEGNHVMEGAPLLKISNLNTVWANFDVYENQISQFKKGQEVVVTTNAYPAKEFKSKVSFIDPILDNATRTIKLRVVLNNRKGLFKPGMFVEGKVQRIAPSIVDKQSILIPASAVLWTGKRSVVYVKSTPDEPIFEMREVTLGSKMGENYEVIKGLEGDEEIVVNGTFTIDATAQLQGKRSMMNQNKSSKDIVEKEIVSRISVDSKFQNQLKTVFDDYIKLKNALVNDNPDLAKDAASVIISSLGKVDMKLLKDNAAHTHWMTVEKEIKSSANSIADVTEIEKQRDHFIHLSSHLTSAIQLFGVNQEIYNQFCPMANDNKGAYWLSLEKEIKNPYFGDKMLNCGSVKEIIE